MTLQQFELLWKRFVNKWMQSGFVWQLSIGIEDNDTHGIIVNETLFETFDSLPELALYLEAQLNEGDAA
jgi:hypothetical protein